MCHYIGVFSDAVAAPFELLQYCVTGYGHTVAQAFFVRPRDLEEKSRRSPAGHFLDLLL